MVKIKIRNDLEDRLKILKKKPEGLHSALRLTMLSCRLFGLLPLAGLNHPTSSKLSFKLFNVYGLIYLISVFGQIWMAGSNWLYLFSVGCTLGVLTNTVFYTFGLAALLVVLKICVNWPNTVRNVETIERKLPPLDSHVSSLCNKLTFVMLLSALVEHLLSIFYGMKVAIVCDADNVLEVFFVHLMPWIFQYTSYSLWKGILGSIFNIQSTLLWSINDLFIMVCSVYLTEHFLVHKKLLSYIMKKDTFYLDDFRKQYTRIVSLVNLLNRQIDVCIISSFSSNLFWICIQLFNSLNKNNTGHFYACTMRPQDTVHYSFEHSFYFVYSFSFLLIRTASAALLASRIRTTSLAPLSMLFQVSDSNFTVEVQRFIDQIKYSKVALSGLGFFSVTREMMLTLAGTIVTYELVLLQFNSGMISLKLSSNNTEV